jgi:hypothetical protein
MTENTEVLLVIWAFCLAVAALDLTALVRLRRAHLPDVAAVLWTVWIVAAPIVGAVSFFIVVRSEQQPIA